MSYRALLQVWRTTDNDMRADLGMFQSQRYHAQCQYCRSALPSQRAESLAQRRNNLREVDMLQCILSLLWTGRTRGIVWRSQLVSYSLCVESRVRDAEECLLTHTSQRVQHWSEKSRKKFRDGVRTPYQGKTDARGSKLSIQYRAYKVCISKLSFKSQVVFNLPQL